MKPNQRIFQWTAALLITCASTLCANPSGHTVISGSVSVSSVGDTLNVNSSSSRSIVEWDAFGIGQGETTNFNLPSSTSAILNRVTGEFDTFIEGNLNSNGIVYLINPHGILVTSDGVVDTATFLASSLDINPSTEYQEFLDGENMTFTGSAISENTVINQGEITAGGGDVILIGYLIDNQGDITTSNGITALGAGLEIVLQPADNNRILIVPQTVEEPGGNGITLGGTITALHAQISGDGNIYEYAINSDGFVHGVGTSSEDCTVTYTAVDGVLLHNSITTAVNNNGVGGDIYLRGHRVEVEVNSSIQAQGSLGGGSIHIGEGNTLIPDSDSIEISQNSNDDSLSASATFSGNGGSVTLVADSALDCHAVVWAKGAFLGNGGTVSMLTPGALDFTSCVDVSGGLLGSPGTVDPSSLEQCNSESFALSVEVEVNSCSCKCK